MIELNLAGASGNSSYMGNTVRARVSVDTKLYSVHYYNFELTKIKKQSYTKFFLTVLYKTSTVLDGTTFTVGIKFTLQ